MMWIEVMASSSGKAQRLTINAENVAYVRRPAADVDPLGDADWCLVDMAHGQDWDRVLHPYRDVVDALYAEGVFVSLVDDAEGSE